jgi:hypothetical protein
MASFTSVLKKIGLVLLDGAQIATEVLGMPFISGLLGSVGTKIQGATITVLSDFNSVAQIVSLMEAAFAGPGTGPQKLAAASPLVQQLVMSWALSNLPGHNKVKDPALLATSVSGLTSSFAGILNSFGA